MRLVAALVLLASAAVAQNTLSPEEKKAGWILLFDGQTMKGWVDPREKTPPGDAWTIEDGCIVTLPNPRLNEDLFSADTYRDFELQWEWRISPRGNSGVKYRIQDHVFTVGTFGRFELSVERGLEKRSGVRPARGQDYVIGFEYQMTDDAANLDALFSRKHKAGSLYDVMAPSENATRRAGEWNQSRIVVRGKHVEHWLNGVKVVDTTLDSPEAKESVRKRWDVGPRVARLLLEQPRRDCPISLQNHGDKCWFRSIKIRRIE